VCVRPELVGRDDREELIALHRIAIVDEQLADLSRDLRAHDHIVGGHDACQLERGGLRQLGVGDDAGHEDHRDNGEEQFSRHCSNVRVQTYV
jgi:hypothetical protein